jgi:hypothetical protein
MPGAPQREDHADTQHQAISTMMTSRNYINPRSQEGAKLMAENESFPAVDPKFQRRVQKLVASSRILADATEVHLTRGEDGLWYIDVAGLHRGAPRRTTSRRRAQAKT